MNTPLHRFLPALGVFLLVACGSDSTGTGGRPAVASVTVAPAARGNTVSNLVAIGDTVRLLATVKDGAGNVLADRVVTWRSSNPALATVSATGLVTGLARDATDTLRATIVTATIGRVSGSASITVVAVYPLYVSVVPLRASVATSGSQNFITDTLWFDFTNSGVTWSITGCTAGPAVCGSLTNVTTTSVTYTAPATVPLSTPSVTATLVRDNTKSGTVSVQITAISADGQIAFGSNRDNSDDIYLMNPDGSVNRLTTMGRAYYPTWSPDGTKIAFQGKFSEELFFVGSLYVMNADGSGLARLGNNPTNDYDPAWSPDGTKIAFVSYRDGNLEIYVMNADGTAVTRLTNDLARDLEPAWSPDGTKIAFTSRRDGNDEIYVMNADGTGQVNLNNSPAADYGPSWSPDATKIAFASTRDGNAEIYVMNADGTGVTRLTNDPLHDVEPAWSPDGTKIAFWRSGFLGPEEILVEQIYVMNADGSGAKGLTTNGWDPSWRPQPAP